MPHDAQTATVEAGYAALPASLVKAQLLDIDSATRSLSEFTASAARVVVLAGAGVEHADAAPALRDFAEG